MTEVEVDRKLLYNKLYKGRRRDLEIHTYADVADVYRVYTPVWGKWGKSLMIYPEETLRKRRSRASLNAEKSAFLAKLNKVQDNNIEVVPDFSSPRDELQNKPVLPINNSSKSELQIKSLAALSDDDEKMDERKEN